MDKKRIVGDLKDIAWYLRGYVKAKDEEGGNSFFYNDHIDSLIYVIEMMNKEIYEESKSRDEVK